MASNAQKIISFNKDEHLLIHLGVSGYLRIGTDDANNVHVHVEFVIKHNKSWILQYHDIRKNGHIQFIQGDPQCQKPLNGIGIYSFDDDFGGSYLYDKLSNRKATIKSLITNQSIVSGIGNIYSTEALFRAGIHPACKANEITRDRYDVLAKAIASTLEDAVAAGGTTLDDAAYANVAGEPGGFKTQVYGRKYCEQCGQTIIKTREIDNRTTYYYRVR